MEETAVIHSLGMSRSPEAVLAEAGAAAKALVRVVRQNGWELSLGGKRKHLQVEAWQTVAHFYGISARVVDDRYVEFGGAAGFEATADAILLSTGQVLSTAKAMCLNDEEKWHSRAKYEWSDGPNGREKVKVGEELVPLYQLRSMAQTRACGKVLRGVLAWVVAMAGYSPTPAEEMTGREYGTPPQPSGDEGGGERSEPQRASEQPRAVQISEAQRKRLWAIAREGGWTAEQVKRLLAANGFQRSEEITRDKYEFLCTAVKEAPSEAVTGDADTRNP